MEDFQKEAVKIYRELSNIPTLSGVHVFESNKANLYNVETTWAHKDLGRNKKIVSSTTGVLSLSNSSELSFVKSFSSHELNGEQLTKYSRCGTKKCVLREVLVKEKKHQFLEVWSGVVKSLSVDLTEKDKHGVVHSNPAFNSMDWSHDGNKILYVAEKKLPKTKSFFKESTEENVTSGDEYVYRQSWGEQLIKCVHPTLYVFDTVTMEITNFDDSLPEEISIADAQWTKGDQIVFTAWHNLPYKLGLIYCKNRPSTIYSLDVGNKKVEALTFGESCVFSVRVNPDSSSLVYIETEPFGPHSQCGKLHRIDISGSNEYSESQLVVDVVNDPTDANSFHGIFVDAIPYNNWVSNGQFICHTIHRSNVALCSIDIQSGSVEMLTTSGSWVFCFAINSIIFTAFSTPDSPQRLKAGLFKAGKAMEWSDLDVPCSPITDLQWEIVKHIPALKNDEYPNVNFESIIIKPVSGDIKGLIVNPHGGPHTCISAGFDPFMVGWSRLGFAIVRINYRGSTGFGKSSVFSLPGKIGTQDVSDVHQAALDAVQKLSISPGNVFVQGGSHGGFLTLHMIGQYPEFYAAGATRNPVCNLVTMHNTSDINDWIFCEAGLRRYQYGQPLSDADYAQMLKVSPITHATKAKAPLLLMIGDVDMRVPKSQGHAYAKILQTNNVPVKILEYPDNNHPISEVLCEADCFVNISSWFNKYRSDH